MAYYRASTLQRCILPTCSAVAVVAASYLGGSSSRCETTKNNKPRLIFIGTGSSTGCPRPACPLLFNPNAKSTSSPSAQQTTTTTTSTTTRTEALRRDMTEFCHVSNLAAQGDPKHNKNYRNNPSLVLSFYEQNNQQEQVNIIIDVGKTFREAALRWLPDAGVTQLDAIILTHHHMDAAAGLDDVRGFQQYANNKNRPPNVPPRAKPMPLYLEEPCLLDLQDRFPWLLPKKQESKQKQETTDKPLVNRHVASFDVTVLQHYQPFTIRGLQITPLPVMHGEDLICLGFAFTLGTTNVIYLSDISRMLPATLDFIQTQLPPTDILIVDALHPTRQNPVHYSLEQAVELAQEHIRPRQQTLLVGSNCDSFPPHEETNELLREKYTNVQMAHDGLVLELD